MVLYYVDDASNKNIIKNKFYTYKEAFLQPDQHDVKVLIGLLRCYKYLLLTPIDFDEANRRLGKYLSIFLSLVCAVYCCFSIKSSYGALADSPITHFLLTALFCVTNVLFLITCFLNANTFKQENWKLALNCIDQAEYMLRKLNFQTPKRNFLLFLQVGFVFVPYLALTIFRILLWINVGDLTTIYLHVGSCMTYFSMCLFLIFMMRLTGVLRTRYNFVEDNLRRIATGKMDDQEKMKRLSEMFRLYKIFIILLDNLNEIFGWHLFLYVSVSISYTLFAVSYNMKINTDNDLEKNLSISSIVITIIYIVALIALTMSCDALENSGKKVINTCYILHESTESRLVKDHLLQMAEYAEKWRPTLSAAGFYNINQSTLSAVFEAIITYLVIIIQFNLALA